jgi:hypothetical protein
MKVVTLEEAQAWLSANKWDAVFSHDWLGYQPVFKLPLPVDTGAKTSLGRRLVNLHEGPGLFLITEWGVWPSSENIDIFYGYRKQFGEERSLMDAPGHFFDTPDISKLQSLLHISLYCYWDALLVWQDWDVAIWTSHDEVVAVHTRTEASRAAIEQVLHDFLKPELS